MRPTRRSRETLRKRALPARVAPLTFDVGPRIHTMKTLATLEFDKSADSEVWVACKSCARDTNHRILKSVDETGSEPMGGGNTFDWRTSYQVIQCLGCRTVSFREVSSNSEDYDHDEEGNIEYRESELLYPSRTEGREVIDDSELLPRDLERVYSEVLAALNNRQSVLAGIGVRAIIETVAKDKGASGRDLSQRIDGLVALGVLTKDGAAILHKLRILGNAAAHEVKAHSVTELNLAMDVVEHLLQAVYILPFHASRTFK